MIGKEDNKVDNKELMEICETLERTIKSANEKIRGAGGKLSAGDADFVDKLLHSLKSVKAVMKMDEEAEMDDEYSERMYSRGYDRGGSYRGSYDGGSNGRGRMNARRDSMGRYSSNDGYSRGGSMVDELRDMMNDAPDADTRQELQNLIRKMENR